MGLSVIDAFLSFGERIIWKGQNVQNSLIYNKRQMVRQEGISRGKGYAIVFFHNINVFKVIENAA